MQQSETIGIIGAILKTAAFAACVTVAIAAPGQAIAYAADTVTPPGSEIAGQAGEAVQASQAETRDVANAPETGEISTAESANIPEGTATANGSRFEDEAQDSTDYPASPQADSSQYSDALAFSNTTVRDAAFELEPTAEGEISQPDIPTGPSDSAKTDNDSSNTDPVDERAVEIRYRANAQKSGWTSWAANNKIAGATAKAKRERDVGFQISIDTGSYVGGVEYRVRLNSGKWAGWKTSGTEIGPNKKIEAIQIRLTGEIAETYDVVYRVLVEDVGWQRRMRNGETAGTTGRKLAIQALRINLVDKAKAAGWIKGDDGWQYYLSGKPVESAWVVTKESPINEILTGMQRYWIDANGILAINRYVNPADEIDAQAAYVAYATNVGLISRGKYTSKDGILLSDDDGKLYTKTRWLTTDLFDGTTQRYRLESNGVCAIVKTGLFNVNGKQFYGWEDDRGYLLRSTTWWVANGWYKANAKGVLKSAESQTAKHIERYVKWAVKIAKDDAHGYSQATRWGPDYDCSSLVISAVRAAGFPETRAYWTGNLKAALKKIGFVWHTNLTKLRRGDIMLVHNSIRQHTEIYLGNNRLVGAHSSENGGIYGREGDQTGREISVVKYYSAPWQGFLRYRG